MSLNKQVQLFLAISERFLKPTGDLLSVDDSRKADETSMTVYAHCDAVHESLEPLR
jgi:hypothetical protein